MFYLKLGYPLLLFVLSSFSAYTQPPASEILQSKNYQSAKGWLKENKWIKDSLSLYGIPADEALAVIFPELTRYSALEDKMEVTGLMVLYTRMGKVYADFSVGRFQMKPSFIRQLELDAREYLSPKKIHCICPSLLSGADNQSIRRKRVNSLTNVKKEVGYLALYYLICLKRFEGLSLKDKTERIKLLATAYNCGYHLPERTLYRQMNKKQFPFYNGLQLLYVNYASLSLLWWKQAHREDKLTLQ